MQYKFVILFSLIFLANQMTNGAEGKVAQEVIIEKDVNLKSKLKSILDIEVHAKVFIIGYDYLTNPKEYAKLYGIECKTLLLNVNFEITKIIHNLDQSEVENLFEDIKNLKFFGARSLPAEIIYQEVDDRDGYTFYKTPAIELLMPFIINEKPRYLRFCFDVVQKFPEPEEDLFNAMNKSQSYLPTALYDATQSCNIQ